MCLRYFILLYCTPINNLNIENNKKSSIILLYSMLHIVLKIATEKQPQKKEIHWNNKIQYKSNQTKQNKTHFHLHFIQKKAKKYDGWGGDKEKKKENIKMHGWNIYIHKNNIIYLIWINININEW